MVEGGRLKVRVVANPCGCPKQVVTHGRACVIPHSYIALHVMRVNYISKTLCV